MVVTQKKLMGKGEVFGRDTDLWMRSQGGNRYDL